MTTLIKYNVFQKALFLFLTILFFNACQPNPATTTKSKPTKELPNIILLIGDDQGYPYFGFMGADYVQTPSMDKLAASGTLFTDGYVPANHCRPSLQSLMTGTLPIDHEKAVQELLQKETSNKRFDSPESQQLFERDFKHHAMKSFETLPKLLAQKGYSSFQGGKWWEFNYQNGGFTHGMTNGWTAEERKPGHNWFKKFIGGDGLQLARATMEPVYDFIDKNGDQPFFMWYAPELPHYPLNAPEKYYGLYRDKNMTESAKRYYANCTWFDDGVGELIRYLKEKGKFENTLFVYVNDNGWEQNPDQEFRADSMRWHNGGDKGKLSMYDQSFRTPIIFSWEGQIAKNVRKTDLIHSADIPATILDYVGMDVPENYFGQSYKAVIKGKQANLRTEIIGNITQSRSETNMMGRKLEGYWIRDKNWFFNWNVTDDVFGLFNMNKDPLNNKNLEEQYSDLVKSYSKKVMDWRAAKK